MNADGCCQATIGCFKGNPDCVALQVCMLKCGGGTTTGPTADGGTIITAGKTLFITEVYPGTQGTCAGCHLAAGPGPQFYLPTADGNYTQFKARAFTSPTAAS